MLWRRRISAVLSVFEVEEIERSRTLQALFWVLLFGFYISFSIWCRSSEFSRTLAAQGRHFCPSYFANCAQFYWFDPEPYSFSQGLLYAFLGGLMTVSAIAAWRKRWEIACLCLVPLILFKIAYVVFLTFNPTNDVEHFHIAEVLLFLFATRKFTHLRRTYVIILAVAATAKFTDAWISGSYFTSQKMGMPLFPEIWVPLLTNLVVIFEIISPWFLLSQTRRIRWTVVGLWGLFHIFSIAVVNFRFPGHCIPLLLVLFLPDPDIEERDHRSSKRDLFGGVFATVIVAIALVDFLLPGHNPYEQQGRMMSPKMFLANHQCVSEETIHYKDGRQAQSVINEGETSNPCIPYMKFFRLQQKCSNSKVSSIRWRFLSSINGRPFYEIINTENVCALQYQSWRPNDWIKLPEQGAPIAGYPRRNDHFSWRRNNDSILNDTQVIGPTGPLQEYLMANTQFISGFYWLFWLATPALVFVQARRRRSRLVQK